MFLPEQADARQPINGRSFCCGCKVDLGAAWGQLAGVADLPPWGPKQSPGLLDGQQPAAASLGWTGGTPGWPSPRLP